MQMEGTATTANKFKVALANKNITSRDASAMFPLPHMLTNKHTQADTHTHTL